MLVLGLLLFLVYASWFNGKLSAIHKGTVMLIGRPSVNRFVARSWARSSYSTPGWHSLVQHPVYTLISCENTRELGCPHSELPKCIVARTGLQLRGRLPDLWHHWAAQHADPETMGTANPHPSTMAFPAGISACLAPQQRRCTVLQELEASVRVLVSTAW